MTKCTSLFATRSWVSLSTKQENSLPPSNPEMMSALSAQNIPFVQLAVGPNTLWGVDRERYIYWWDGEKFVEYNYSYELVNDYIDSHSSSKEENEKGEKKEEEKKEEEGEEKKEKEEKAEGGDSARPEGDEGDREGDEDDIFDVEMNTIVYISVDIKGNVFGVLESGEILLLKREEETQEEKEKEKGEEKKGRERKSLGSAPSEIRKISVLDQLNMWAINAQVFLLLLLDPSCKYSKISRFSLSLSSFLG